MKNVVSLFLLLFIYSETIGQITITQNHLPSVNDTIHYKIGTLSSFDPDTTGENYTWDFSQVSANNERADTIISVTQTPVAYNVVFNFLIANQAYINQTPPSLGVGITVSDYYDFFKKASNYYRKAGFGATINGVQTPVKYDNPELYFKLPLTYGTTDSSVSSYGLSIPSYGYFGQTIKRVHVADGWGIIHTPFGTYNTIRVKHVIDIKDTIFNESLNYGFTITRPRSYEYYWLTDSPIRTYAAKVYKMGMANTIEFFYNPTTYISSIENFPISIFPNPCHQNLFIVNSAEELPFVMYSTLGKLVRYGILHNGTNKISTADLSDGLYFFKVWHKDQCKILKLVIKH